MGRAPLRTLIRLQPEPETTLNLQTSVARPELTVRTYIFTDTIRRHFEGILEQMARGEGQGFWIQAEYGAGKTHFLAALASLMAGGDAVWEQVHDEAIRPYRRRLQNTRLFPVVISLRGEAEPGVNSRPLFDVIERGLERSLERNGLRDAVRLTLTEDLLDWLDGQPAGTRRDVEAYVQQQSGLARADLREAEGSAALARQIRAYCGEHSIRPQVATSVKDRLRHVYEQVTAASLPGGTCDGLLFVIDEYEGWEKSRPRGSPQQAQDEDLLETMAFVLPKGEGLRMFTLVASQTEVPAKLRGEHGGDRFINVPLLAGAEHDYDLIVSRRVRELEAERQPEIDDYYHTYAQQFDSIRDLGEAQFRDVFPFQPRCFDVVRPITARELPTARSGILILWQTLNQARLLERDTLIRVADLLESPHLVECLNTTVYRPALEAYRVARMGLESLGLEADDLSQAQDVLATLFLWHLAHLEQPQPLSFQDLAQVTLTVSDLLRAEDAVAYVLSKMQELPQVRLEEQGARFVVAGVDPHPPVEVFERFRQAALRDTYGIAQAWTEALFLTPREAGGQAGLFGDFKPDEMRSMRAESRRLEYSGGAVAATRWQLDWGLALPREDVHFRIVILTRHQSEAVQAESLQDARIAVVVPPDLDEEARARAVDYLAWQRMEEQYRERSGPQAEEVRTWLATRRSSIVRDLLMKQINLYRSASVTTRDGLAIDVREALALPNTERRIAYVADRLLAAAYHELPLDSARLRDTVRPGEVGKLFEGLFGRTAKSAAQAALRHYGVALGLVSPDQPTGFRPTACRALDLIGEMFEECQAQGRELPAWRVYERLSGVPYGLPYPLVQLYLLAFVRRGQPPVELALKPGHKLRLQDGQPLPRPCLTMNNVVTVEWRPGLEQGFEALVLAAGPTWDEVVPFTQRFRDDLHTTLDPAEIERQDAALCTAMVALTDEAKAVQGSLEALARSLAGSLPVEAAQTLERMQILGQVGREGYVPFYGQVQEWHATPESLGESVALYRRLHTLGGISAQVQEVKRYLEDVTLRPGDGELAGERFVLLGQLALAELMRNPGLWDSMRGQFEQFQQRYRTAYQKHHRDYYAALERLRARMEEVPRCLQALALLNGIAELGTPVGADLPTRYEDLRTRLTPCSITQVREVDVTGRPACAACGLPLATPAPTAEVEAFLGDLERALGEQKRRLSAEAVHRVLARAGAGGAPGDELARLMEAAQAAEIVRLVDVLDERVAGFIRRLLVADGIVIEPAAILVRLVELHPAVGDDEIPTAVHDFEQLLRQALEEAQKAHPDKKTVRVSLR